MEVASKSMGPLDSVEKEAVLETDTTYFMSCICMVVGFGCTSLLSSWLESTRAGERRGWPRYVLELGQLMINEST